MRHSSWSAAAVQVSPTAAAPAALPPPWCSLPPSRRASQLPCPQVAPPPASAHAAAAAARCTADRQRQPPGAGRTTRRRTAPGRGAPQTYGRVTHQPVSPRSPAAQRCSHVSHALILSLTTPEWQCPACQCPSQTACSRHDTTPPLPPKLLTWCRPPPPPPLPPVAPGSSAATPVARCSRKRPLPACWRQQSSSVKAARLPFCGAVQVQLEVQA